jgi:hypothetical protein
MLRDGSKIRWLKFAGILLCEVKRLLGPATSLASLGSAVGLQESKSIFPFSKFISHEFLLEPKLPSSAKDWVSDLNPANSPSQDQVDSALALFEEKQFSNVGEVSSSWLRS